MGQSGGMARLVALLRGINLGPHNRIAMPQLRAALADAGFEDVRTLLQSGNVVLGGDAPPDQVARACEKQISVRFGLDIVVIVRTDGELAEIVRRDPFGSAASDPKRYQVTFLAHAPDRELVAELNRKIDLATGPSERTVLLGREIYAWHPDGLGRSKLAALLAGRSLGVPATARNWNTVTRLLEMVRA